MKKVIAFTLAETLIVMGIIGVVAALTLPNLNSSTGNKEKVAKLKKIYQNLNDAMGRAQAVYGPFNEWTLNDSNGEPTAKRVGERLTEFMKVSKNCGTNSTQSCFVTSYKTSKSGDTNSLTNGSTAYYKFVSADGTSFAIGGTEEIYVDIDGIDKGPSTSSIDIFRFDITQETGEIVPSGASELEKGVSYLSCGCFGGANLHDCTAWVIQYDNMDYLKCPDKLTDNNTSCK